jgi:hypothetical protein
MPCPKNERETLILWNQFVLRFLMCSVFFRFYCFMIYNKLKRITKAKKEYKKSNTSRIARLSRPAFWMRDPLAFPLHSLLRFVRSPSDRNDPHQINQRLWLYVFFSFSPKSITQQPERRKKRYLIKKKVLKIIGFFFVARNMATIFFHI